MHEADAIRENDMIEEVLEFGPAESDKLRFQVRTGTDSFAIEQKNTVITIIVPRSIIQNWTTTDLVGFEEAITSSKGSVIRVLIEKDFACLDGEREDEEGSYPNPLGECKV
jgi:hypothetical protein